MSQAIKSLLLYKLHTPKCPVHKSRIPLKTRRFFFDCECPIYIKGALQPETLCSGKVRDSRI